MEVETYMCFQNIMLSCWTGLFYGCALMLWQHILNFQVCNVEAMCFGQ